MDAWVEEKGLTEYRDEFQKGALIARTGQRDDGFEYVSRLSEDEKGLLRHEITHRWDHPFMLYFLVVLCAGSAIVQGMDQTAVNGAQVSGIVLWHSLGCWGLRSRGANVVYRFSTSENSASPMNGSKGFSMVCLLQSG